MSQTLLDILLAEQTQPTAVERFARAHETYCPSTPSQRYQHLLPAKPPGPGQQYAFEVDLDRCSGCKACVTACHSLNGLDENETWRDVGLLLGGTSAKPVLQHVTAACHHCLDPACLTACPVNAYEKDPLSGIVRHLDDQCFGCQYCTLACPYDVPKYHSGKGIVRKCDMCSQRLAVGEAPACAQACPNEAIAIRLVNLNEVRENAEADPFLPAAPEPHITYPTTAYKTSRVFPRNLLPADYHQMTAQHPHLPLIVMLVLTQLSVGAYLVGGILDVAGLANSESAFRIVQSTNSLLFGLVALASSVLHLGRPQFAFRAILGLRHSWLSREIVAFGLFAAAAMLFAASAWIHQGSIAEIRWLGGAVAASGVAGLYCSAMIYVFTQREFWSFGRTMTRFVLTAAVLGIAATWVTILLVEGGIGTVDGGHLRHSMGRLLARGLVAAMAAKLTFEAAAFRHLLVRRNTPLKRSARLMTGPLSNQTLARFLCGVLGGVVMPLLLLSHDNVASDARLLETAMVLLMFIACLAGELLERYLFFAAAAAPRMPGALRS